jgi:hypothetical protein
MFDRIKGVISGDRSKLVASIVANALARVPGLATIILILPLTKAAVGTASYGTMLSMLSLGSVCTFVFGGLGAFGRRELSFAHSRKMDQAEADVFATVWMLSIVLGLLLCVVITGVAYRETNDKSVIAVTWLPIIASVFNNFDNLRSAYNEHYVTALWQVVSQVVILVFVLWWGISSTGIFIWGLISVLPFMVASLNTGVGLVLTRPYLLRGRIVGIQRALGSSFDIAIADGAIFAALNFSVYWLGIRAPEEAAAYGTLVRLFQSLLTPMMLLLFPLTGFISLKWPKIGFARQAKLLRGAAILGSVYGIAVALIIFFAGRLYLEDFIGISAEGQTLYVVAVAILGGAVCSYKACSGLAYSGGDARSLFAGVALAIAFTASLAGLASYWLTVPGVVALFSISSGAIIWSWAVFDVIRRSLQIQRLT